MDVGVDPPTQDYAMNFSLGIDDCDVWRSCTSLRLCSNNHLSRIYVRQGEQESASIVQQLNWSLRIYIRN